jgi:hypothetical protein
LIHLEVAKVSKLDKKPKKGVAVVISIGPKMKTKPTDAATPEMPIKKYGSMPMKKAWSILKNEDYPPMSTRSTPRSSPYRFMNENRIHREGAQNHAREDDINDSEYEDMEDMEPPYGKPEFGNEGAREAEMNQAERAAIMAEGMPEMQRPRSAPRPGDPRFRGSRRSDAPPNSEGYPPFFNSDVEDSAHNQPRPSMPRDVFANR